ncbi:hypothetical protein ACFFGH_17325 [Lysobacter korlensis]|uniref:DUF5056 domain-containing protein n=1 Tax=Lysobacter korlensis TaxID=553636 RepID=A0ABV6RRL4_9GAMM
MNPLPQDEIEALLRKQFDGPISDDGFSDRLMRQLPPHRQRRATWPLWAGIITGAAACWLALLPSPLLHLGWRDSFNGEWSAASVSMVLAIVVMVMLASAWAMLEADNR